ncbi:MAG: hypothetical protein R3F43_23825 [bacterium]
MDTSCASVRPGYPRAQALAPARARQAVNFFSILSNVCKIVCDTRRD